MQHIAFLVFQSLRKGSYLHDGEISMLSARLRQEGVKNDIVEVVMHGSDAQENESLLADLVENVVAAQYSVLVFHRIWDPAIPATLRTLFKARNYPVTFVYHPAKDMGEYSESYDFVVKGYSLAIFNALGHAPTPIIPSQVPGLYYRDASGEFVCPQGSGPQDNEHSERWRYSSNFARVRINPETSGRPPNVVIYGNPGCPYRRNVANIKFWKNVPLDPQTTNTKGCSFCDVNLSEDYRFVAGIGTECTRQILEAQSDLPDVYEMILLDQDPFPFLPELFQGLLDANARPLHLLIQARADLFLKRTEKFEEALKLARQGRHQLSPFLVGIENFHQPTLEIYNKGVTVEMNVKVLEYLDDVSSRFSDVFDRDKISPGFILWHPWVTFESLRVNAEALAQYKLTSFRSEVVLSKVRLYPDIPFFWKAKQDGLLLDKYGADGFDSATRYGYPEENPYHFMQPEVQAAYTLLACLCRDYEPIHELGLLNLILDWVEAQADYWNNDTKLALYQPDELRSRFEAAHKQDVLALRKQNTAVHHARQLSADEERNIRALVAFESPTSIRESTLARILVDKQRTQLFFAKLGDEVRVRNSPKDALFRLILEPRSDAPHFMQSGQYNISYSVSDDSKGIFSEIESICRAICERDSVQYAANSRP